VGSALVLLSKGRLEMAKATSAKKSPSTKTPSKSLSKRAVFDAVVEEIGDGMTRKMVAQIVDTLAAVGHQELKKNGVFVLPGFAKFVVVKKAAKPAHEGINPFTKEKQMFAAKPASKGVKARPVKAVKDAVALAELRPSGRASRRR
jgi:DNA-binding protein HU-beta